MQAGCSSKASLMVQFLPIHLMAPPSRCELARQQLLHAQVLRKARVTYTRGLVETRTSKSPGKLCKSTVGSAGNTEWVKVHQMGLGGLCSPMPQSLDQQSIFLFVHTGLVA